MLSENILFGMDISSAYGETSLPALVWMCNCTSPTHRIGGARSDFVSQIQGWHSINRKLMNRTILFLGEGNGTPLQYSCLENPMDGGAWLAAVHGVAKSRTRLSDCTFTFHFHALEKETATHSSVLAWRIPGPGEPGGLPSMGSHRVGHDWSDLAAANVLSERMEDLIASFSKPSHESDITI